MSSLVVALYSATPVDAAKFETYLHDLTITAYEVDFDHPTTLAAPPHAVIGAASYTNAAAPANRIYQLRAPPPPPFPPFPPPPPVPQPAAAAVIQVAAAIAGKYLLPQSLINVVLDVERGAPAPKKVVDHSLNYDVEVDNAVVPNVPVVTLAGVTVGLYLALPDPKFDPGGAIAFVSLPADGSPPSYGDLDHAVSAVLNEDGGAAAPDPSKLSPAQCLHVARELVSNRTVRPLPMPPKDLWAISASPADDKDRTKFEGALRAYYNQLSAEATRLAGYVYAWSAAQNCQQLSRGAAHAALTLPVRLTTTASSGQEPEATVILGN